MKAFIFDLNGTMINDMDYHTSAWFSIMNNDLGGNFTREEVKQNMYGKNQEVLKRMLGDDRFTEDEMNKLSIEKEKRYQQEFLPKLALLPGLTEFLEKAYQANISMAIASAAVTFNIDFVLDGLNIRHYFKATVSADDVVKSKPDPETFLKAARLLGVKPKDCMVFEDAPKGAESAQNADMKAVVLTTTHEQHEFTYLKNVLHIINNFNDEFVKTLI